MNIIELNNINLSFNKQLIFENATLALSEPGFYALVGPNGSGKTTLFNILTNRVQIYSGEVITSRDDISYCDANSLLFSNLTVRENLNLVSNDEDHIINLLNKFHVEKLLDVYPKRLSEGERQRIAIIRTILEDKQVMLLDEVTSHIDNKNAHIVLDYLKELSKNHIIIYATHFKKEVRIYADSQILIENHKIVVSDINYTDKRLIDKKVNSYNPSKILNKIIRFKPDFVFTALFVILISFTLSIIWLSSITKITAIKNVETKSLNSKYSVIDDYSMNIYDYYFKSYSTGTFRDETVSEFVNRNSKFKLGLKSYYLSNGANNWDSSDFFIQYYLFDNSLSDNEIVCSNYTYNSLVNDYSLASNYTMNYRGDTFHITVIEGEYPFTFFITNEYTYKVISKFHFNYHVATINDTQVHLTSGRMPENDDEILKSDTVYGEDTQDFVFGDQRKTFKIVGTYDYVIDSIYDDNPWYVVYSNHAFDFKLEASDVLKTVSQGFIAYGDTLDLTPDDINFILDNDLYVINDVMKYAYESYVFVNNLRDSIVKVLIFVITLDIVTISYYISYWLHSNNDRYDELKRLNKIKLVKNKCISTRFILCLITFSIGVLLYLIAQNLINKVLVGSCFSSVSLYTYNFSFINNTFLYYAIPLLILIEMIVGFIQVERSIYD